MRSSIRHRGDAAVNRIKRQEDPITVRLGQLVRLHPRVSALLTASHSDSYPVVRDQWLVLATSDDGRWTILTSGGWSTMDTFAVGAGVLRESPELLGIETEPLWSFFSYGKASDARG